MVVFNPLFVSNGTVGIDYSQSVGSATGGYIYSVTAGSLPPGLSLDAVTGVISGTPTVSGSFSFIVQVGIPGCSGAGGTVNSQAYTITVSTTAAMCTQFFDTVQAPSLPPNWSSVGTGSLHRWITTANNPDATMSNAAFTSAAPETGNSEMTTQVFIVPGGGAQMTFRNAFNLESDQFDPNVGYDGMVLEISVNGSAFQDLVDAGGSFVTGGYNKTISGVYGSSLAGRMAWSGLSGGTSAAPQYMVTTVNLPASAAGQMIRLKWVVATDNKATAGNISGAWIDSIICGACSTTAAGVEISGRVTTPDGRGLRSAIVSITDPTGVTKRAVTGSFGYYRFDDVAAGHSYVVTVGSRRYRFTPRMVSVTDSLTGLDFTGNE